MVHLALTAALLAACGAGSPPPPASRTARGPVAATLDPGCGCTTVGNYVPPDVASPAETSSTYLVDPRLSGDLVDLTVRRKSDGAQVFSTSIPKQAAWGFSADGARFFYTYLDGAGTVSPTQNVHLVNLATTPPRNTQVAAWAASSTVTVFSPGGQYFLAAAMLSPDIATFQVLDAATGARVYPSAPGSFTIRPPPGWSGDSLDVAGWGFGPDGKTLAYAFQDVGTGTPWLIVQNLAAGREIVRRTFGASARWGFSPCGDVVAVDELPASTFLSTLYDTTASKAIASYSGPPAPSMTHSTTDPAKTGAPSQHVLTVQSGPAKTVYPFVPNTAGLCAPSSGPAGRLDSLSLAPMSVAGGAVATGTVTLGAPAPPDDVVVRLAASSSVATVPTSVRVRSGARTATFPVSTRAPSTTSTVTVTATYDVQRTASLQVTAPPPPPPRHVSGVALSRTSVVGGFDVIGTVALSGSAPTTTVTLASDVPSLVIVPASITVPAGATSGTFTVATRGVALPLTTSVTASSGGASASAELQLTPPEAVHAEAVVQDPGCLANVLAASDDGSSAAIALPVSLSFFGSTYASLFVNTNGSVSFDAPVTFFTPSAGCGFSDAGATKTAGPGLTVFGLPNAPFINRGLGEIVAGPDGNLWFAESQGARMGRSTPAGDITEFAIPNPTGGFPDGIVAGPDGNLWFVDGSVWSSDTGRGASIVRLTPAGEFTYFQILDLPMVPAKMAVGLDGNLWFTETPYGNAPDGSRPPDAIGRLTVATGTITHFTLPTPASYPEDIVAGPDGALWFTEFWGNQIGRITVNGDITEFPNAMAARHPNRIAAGPDGNLWFTEYDLWTPDQSGNLVARITPDGVVTEFPIPTACLPGAIAVGPDGNLWFIEERTTMASNIARMTTAGVITEYEIPSPIFTTTPRDITAGPDGNIWLTLSTNQIGRFTLP